MHWSDVWHSPLPASRLARAALTPASWLYTLGWEAYQATYELGLKRPKQPHSPIVCIGNLLVGGTGKTPVAIHVAECLSRLGKNVIVSANGYRASKSQGAELAPAGDLSASVWGDEPAVIRSLLPETPIVVGRDRVLAAQVAHRLDPTAVLLLDDGFQHLPLRKTLTILLDPEQSDNSRCLPAGPYREPRRHRRRADLVLPGEFQIVTAPTELRLPNRQPASRPGSYVALCAIGNPAAFFTALSSLGAPPKNSVELALPDHDSLLGGNLIERLPVDKPVIVTEKDWVKLRERPDVEERSFLIASHRVQIEPSGRFQSWLDQKIHGC